MFKNSLGTLDFLVHIYKHEVLTPQVNEQLDCLGEENKHIYKAEMNIQKKIPQHSDLLLLLIASFLYHDAMPTRTHKRCKQFVFSRNSNFPGSTIEQIVYIEIKVLRNKFSHYFLGLVFISGTNLTLTVRMEPQLINLIIMLNPYLAKLGLSLILNLIGWTLSPLLD